MNRNNLECFEEFQNKLREIYIKKNHDYGNSFDRTFDDFGLISAVIRLNDKVNRMTSLVKGELQQVTEEGLEDTIQDIAIYAILTLMSMKRHNMIHNK